MYQCSACDSVCPMGLLAQADTIQYQMTVSIVSVFYFHVGMFN